MTKAAHKLFDIAIKEDSSESASKIKNIISTLRDMDVVEESYLKAAESLVEDERDTAIELLSEAKKTLSKSDKRTYDITPYLSENGKILFSIVKHENGKEIVVEKSITLASKIVDIDGKDDDKISPIITFVLGALIGSVATYMIMKRKMTLAPRLQSDYNTPIPYHRTESEPMTPDNFQVYESPISEHSNNRSDEVMINLFNSRMQSPLH